MATTAINRDVLAAVKQRQEQLKKNVLNSEAQSITAESEVPERQVVIEEGWKAYSDVFGKAHSGQEHAVKVFSDNDWPEELRIHIPDTEKFDGYIFPREQGERFVVGLMQGDKILLHGPKGSGKSSLPEYVCSVLRIPFIRVNCREDMDSGAIFGTVSVKGGNMEWCPGPAEELGLHGGLLQVDEISATPPGINMAMQYMLEEDGKIYLADKPADSKDKLINPNEWFRIVATDNTQLQGDSTGMYTGTQVQNSAMLDRFQTTLEIGYLSSAHEKKILKKKVKDLPASWINDMIKLAGLVRTAYNEGQTQYTMSPRTLISWGKKAVYWTSPIEGLRLAFMNKLVEEDKKLINDLVFKVYGQYA